MTEFAIQLHALNKQFGRRKQRVHAVRNLTLDVARGQVYGFLGPNGAGKSTTIRMVVDLIRPTSGEVWVLDRPVHTSPNMLASSVGSLVEGATFYDFLTGRKNLAVLAQTNGCYDAARIQLLLEQVGMADRADRKVGGYSTGMKQRLGIAAALLNDPQLVILDEPTNGLDPAGIQEVRQFIRDLVDKQGKTVFLSSHLLGEVEQVCDRVAIIADGRLVREGSVVELLAQQGTLLIEADPLADAVALLSPRYTVQVEDNRLRITAEHAQTPEIVAQLVNNQIQVFQVQSERQTLEDYFLAAVGDSFVEGGDD